MLTPTLLYTTVGHTCQLLQSYTIQEVTHMLTPIILYTTVGHTHANSYNLTH